jgi:hypothetical protein
LNSPESDWTWKTLMLSVSSAPIGCEELATGCDCASGTVKPAGS